MSYFIRHLTPLPRRRGRVGVVGPALHFIGKVEEKIMIKDYGNAFKQLAVDRGTRENVIDVCPVAVNLPGKPCCRATARLTVENFFDCFADVFHFRGAWAVQLAIAQSTSRNRIQTLEIVTQPGH